MSDNTKESNEVERGACVVIATMMTTSTKESLNRKRSKDNVIYVNNGIFNQFIGGFWFRVYVHCALCTILLKYLDNVYFFDSRALLLDEMFVLTKFVEIEWGQSTCCSIHFRCEVWKKNWNSIVWIYKSTLHTRWMENFCQCFHSEVDSHSKCENKKMFI